MYFKFQESHIWEAGNPVDPNGEIVRLKAKSVEKARKRLPRPSLGRVWVQVEDNGVEA